jgi:hypothetical protein
MTSAQRLNLLGSKIEGLAGLIGNSDARARYLANNGVTVDVSLNEKEDIFEMRLPFESKGIFRQFFKTRPAQNRGRDGKFFAARATAANRKKWERFVEAAKARTVAAKVAARKKTWVGTLTAIRVLVAQINELAAQI